MPYVEVEVYVDPCETLRSLDEDELQAELDRRRAKRNRGADQPALVSLLQEDLDEGCDCLYRGCIEDALILLERILPRPFCHLSQDVARFYAGGRQ